MTGTREPTSVEHRRCVGNQLKEEQCDCIENDAMKSKEMPMYSGKVLDIVWSEFL